MTNDQGVFYTRRDTGKSNFNGCQPLSKATDCQGSMLLRQRAMFFRKVVISG
jgi:hypothetical protein